MSQESIFATMVRIPFVEPSLTPTGDELLTLRLNGQPEIHVGEGFHLSQVETEKHFLALMSGNTAHCTRIFFRLKRVNERLVESWMCEAEMGEWKRPSWNILKALQDSFASQGLYRLLTKGLIKQVKGGKDEMTSGVEYNLPWTDGQIWSDVRAAQLFLERARNRRDAAKKAEHADWITDVREQIGQALELNPWNTNAWLFGAAIELEAGDRELALELERRARDQFPMAHPLPLELAAMVDEPGIAMELAIHGRRSEA